MAYDSALLARETSQNEKAQPKPSRAITIKSKSEIKEIVKGTRKASRNEIQ